MNQQELRKLPAVDDLLDAVDFPENFPRSLRKRVVQSELDRIREQIQDGQKCPQSSEIIQSIENASKQIDANRIQEVINATGVILHTNLGRAPLADPVRDRVDSVTRGYSNLEIDLNSGGRGGRGAFAEALLCQLTGASAAGIVNNCSAALVLALKTLSDDNDVIISRGELVQIGGGFRIPDMLEASGPSLREVGTTNRTTVNDYENALDNDVGLVLKVHRSNFDVVGFTESAPVSELSEFCNDAGIPLVVDLGSGAFWNTEDCDMKHEPRPSEMIDDGADLVISSGDKLMGGPQAGMFLGSERIVSAMKSHPFFRTYRCGKTTLSALEATLELYATDKLHEIPANRMFAMDSEDLKVRAETLIGALDENQFVHGSAMDATVGGGALPREKIPSYGLKIDVESPERMLETLRQCDPPIIGRIHDGAVYLNLRTVPEERDEYVRNQLSSILPDSA